VRIEYEDRDGRPRTLDIEVETLHYRGGHAVSKAASGFSRHSIGTARVIGGRATGGGGGRRGSTGLGLTVSTNRGKGGRPPDPRIVCAHGQNHEIFVRFCVRVGLRLWRTTQPAAAGT
jgi:hypothetical protein